MNRAIASRNCRRRPFWVILLVLMLAGVSLTAAAEDRRFHVTVEMGKVAEEHQTLRVRQGDQVEIVFRSDRPLELHLHGIDVTAIVPAAHPTAMTFRARHAGRFPIESHGGDGHRGLLYVEIHPR